MTTSRDPLQETTLHVRKALGGDAPSLEWVVDHFSPILLVQARYRLGRGLRGRYDPEDLVQQVWAICLPRLGSIVPRDDRYTPVVLRFLSSTLLRHYNNLVEKHLAGKPLTRGEETESLLALLPAEASQAVSRVLRGETIAELTEALLRLPEADREIMILRGVEQLDYRTIGARLDASDEALRARYHRALRKLRSILPASLVREMAES